MNVAPRLASGARLVRLARRVLAALHGALPTLGILALAAAATALSASFFPRPERPQGNLLLASPRLLAGDLDLQLHESAVAGIDGFRVWVRALGLEPRLRLEWRGGGASRRTVRVRLENVNLRAGELVLSPNARELWRRGATVEVEAALAEGPLEVSVELPAAPEDDDWFALFGCSRTNRLLPRIVEDLERDPPLFVMHLGDLGHGLPHEAEAFRAIFDAAGLPVFVSPGNHDASPLDRDDLRALHGALNPAPFTFRAAGQHFVVLDASYFPLATEQLDWLEEVVRAAGPERVRLFLHRTPIDPRGKRDALPPETGVERLKEIVEATPDARVFAGHIAGFARTSWAGHPFVLSAGGGERKRGPEDGPFHHVRVPLPDGPAQLVAHPAPGTLSGFCSRVRCEAPVLLGHAWAGAGILLVGVLARRRRGGRSAGGDPSAAAPKREL